MKHSWLFGSFILLVTVFHSKAQTVGTSPPVSVLYFDLNKSDKSVISEVATENLSLQYYDAIGTSPELPCQLYNWKQEVIAEFSMTKAFGLNQYNISLKDVYGGWEKNSIYSLVTTSEKGIRYEFFFKVTDPPKREIDASITVNPKFLDCGKLTANLVEFYGDVKGGKAPYEINWFVLNDHRTSFLYQPKNHVIKHEGKTSSIEVDKNPDYYVIMHVKDACGNESHQIVHLVCEKGKKKINTVFFENIPDQLKKLKNVQ